MNQTWIRAVFAIAALYDGLIGLAFLVNAPAIFAYFDVTPPNHIGYVQFPALLLLLFGVLFARVAIAPRQHTDLMLYGGWLKLSYTGLVFYHQFQSGVPGMWQIFAWADLVFLVFFAMSWWQIRFRAEPASAG